MLEKMNEFFNKRLDGYDEHMMTTIESSDVFYPFSRLFTKSRWSKNT